MKKKNIKISDAEDVLELASTRLSQLIGKISTLDGNMQLDITAGSTSGKTATRVYVIIPYVKILYFDWLFPAP